MLRSLQKKFTDLLGGRIALHPVEDGAAADLLGNAFTFFDIHSTKAPQYGFTARWADKKLTCLGDEPYKPECERYVRGADWLLSEAFCLYAERDIWKPYEKHHSTVKDACELAQAMGIPNLVLWHTEDSNVAGRERLYKSEGKRSYSGNIFVPDDESLIAL